MKYRGSCHCQMIQFEIETNKIESAMQCNCSICIRKNAIMSKDYFSPSQFHLIQGKDLLSIYHWGDKDVNHYFCKQCGIYPFHDTIYDPGHYRINLCCIDNIDVRHLSIIEFDGKNEL